jgi:branched-chain amino acid transport system substrate-binding protein
MGLAGGHAVADTARAAAAGHDGTWVLDVPPVPAGNPFIEAYRRRYGAAPRGGQSLASYSLLLAVADALRGDARGQLAALDAPLGQLANGWGLRFDARQQNMRAAPVLARWDGGALTLP